MESSQTNDQSSSNAGILPASHWEQAPVTPDELSDADSAYGESLNSTASLTSSIFEYRSLHGRTYHSHIGNAEAWNPNDAQHAESMDIYHHVHLLLYENKLFQAPLPPTIKKVLDIGCGTGSWAIDFADQFPECEVIGLDLSPQQSTWLPPNLKFEIDDAEKQWSWPDDTFDFIHIRSMFGSIADWDALYRQAFRCLKPGGYIEDHTNSVRWECANDTIKEGSALRQWTEVMWEYGRKFGRTFRVYEEGVQVKGMEAAGFEGLVVREWQAPVNGWPEDKHLKMIGLCQRMCFDMDPEGWILHLWHALLGWDRSQVSAFVNHVRKQLNEPNIRPFHRHRMVYARKPEV